MTDDPTATAHNLEHGSDVIKVTTPATAALSARSGSDVDHAGPVVAVVTSNKITLRFPNVDAAVRSACTAYNAGAIDYAEMDSRVRQAREQAAS